MQIVALSAYICSLLISIGVIRQLWRARRYPAVLVSSYLAALTHIRPLLFFCGLDVPLTFVDVDEVWPLVINAHVTISLWMVTFYIAIASSGKSTHIAGYILPPSRSVANNAAILVVAIVCTGVGVLSTLYMLVQYGGAAEFIYAVKVEKELAGIYVIRQVSTVAAIISYYGLLIAITSDRYFNSKSRWGAVFMALIVLNLAANYAWGNRMNIGLFGIVAIASWHLTVRRIKFWRFASLVLAFALALQALRYGREILVSGTLGRDTILSGVGLWRGLSLSLHLVEYDALLLALRDAGSLFDFRWGADFANGVVSWIPRQLWENKPPTFFVGKWFRQIYEPETVNGWPVTVIGSWFLNFSYLGVVIGATLSGWFAEAITRKYRCIDKDSWQAIVGLSAALFLMNGGIDTGFPQQVFLLCVPLWAINLVTRVGRIDASKGPHKVSRSLSRW